METKMRDEAKEERRSRLMVSEYVCVCVSVCVCVFVREQAM